MITKTKTTAMQNYSGAAMTPYYIKISTRLYSIYADKDMYTRDKITFHQGGREVASAERGDKRRN